MKRRLTWLSAIIFVCTLSLIWPNFIFSASAVSATPIFYERVPILMYHYISPAPATTTWPGLYLRPEIFASQLQEIDQQRYQTVFVSDIAKSLRSSRDLPACSVALSFDDGYEDFYSQAFPLLKKYQIKSTLYVIVNRLGQPGYLTKDQLKELAQSGLVEIGSHTFNHLDLRRLKTKDLIFEIKQSRQALQKISGQAVTTFAYPFGYYRPDMFAIASSTGYLAAVSVVPGTEQSADNLWLMPRVRPGERSGQEFGQWLKGEFHVIMSKK